MNSAVLIIEDDVFFYPRFVDRLIAASPLPVAGLIIARPALRYNRSFHLFKKLRCFRFAELVRLALRYAHIVLSDWGCRLLGKSSVYTLQGVARKHQIPFMLAQGNANTPEIVAWVKEKSPLVIFSASPLILRPELLSIPRLSVNLHFSILPAYKGIMPVFYAMAHGEKESGISLHEMTAKIDEGRVLYQTRLALDYQRPLIGNYEMFFAKAVDCVVDCFSSILQGRHMEIAHDPAIRASYFRYPDQAAWELFRTRNVPFI